MCCCTPRARMNDNTGPRGQKRILDDANLNDDVAHIASVSTANSGDQAQNDSHASYRTLIERLMNDDDISSAAEDCEMKPPTPMTGSSTASGTDDSNNVAEDDRMSGFTVGERLRKKVKTSVTRQGSAPPRLELGFGSTNTYKLDISSGTTNTQDQHMEESTKDGDADSLEAVQNDQKEKENMDERMEKLLDDLETEVTCGLCAGTFIDVSSADHITC
ncbi:hypothetical protein QFC22_002004 [Naganishia vaughanmartiniae]|uniref:Uncharacterized protein n=1 Tax=Naganishia vaughanmartiniae TaxID=1424756 RepID=A0ACC2XEV4_9TREE|nr:hypothetical protein QFC22_002004 [Naganishia vaughanmartiniae]